MTFEAILNEIYEGGDMEYEYIALTWAGVSPQLDKLHMVEREQLVDLGWEQFLVLPWHGKGGGVYVMRRPKEE